MLLLCVLCVGVAPGQKVMLGSEDRIHGDAILTQSIEAYLRFEDTKEWSEEGQEGFDRHLRYRATLMSEGFLFEVPETTLAEVLGTTHGNVAYVRIIEGDSKDKTGWIHGGWCNPPAGDARDRLAAIERQEASNALGNFCLTLAALIAVGVGAWVAVRRLGG